MELTTHLVKERFLQWNKNPIQRKQRKNIFLPFQYQETSHYRTLHLIWMFPNQFCSKKMKNNESRSLVDPKYYVRWLEPQPWHFKVWTLERMISWLSLSLFFFFFFGGGRQNLSKSYENHNPYGVIYRVPLVGLSDLSPPRLGSLNLTKNGF